mmetsp:Transcript_10521/g.14662  ORF Transcript_10521/g.14662 Transcript_10521/m.14662 type:complete len:99 (-) Transcript_10521:563-859(-)
MLNDAESLNKAKAMFSVALAFKTLEPMRASFAFCTSVANEALSAVNSEKEHPVALTLEVIMALKIAAVFVLTSRTLALSIKIFPPNTKAKPPDTALIE